MRLKKLFALPMMAVLIIAGTAAYSCPQPVPAPDPARTVFIFCNQKPHTRELTIVFYAYPNGSYRIGDVGEFTDAEMETDGRTDLSLGKVTKGTTVYAYANGEEVSRTC